MRVEDDLKFKHVISIPLHIRTKHTPLMRHFAMYALLCTIFMSFTSLHFEVGQVIDDYNGVHVYYNGKNFTNVVGRNVTYDGYNLGLKYQCVEYVKRYYYQVYGHKMPNSYGHAKDLFDKDLKDIEYNPARGLMQYKNVRYTRPQEGDILVYDSYSGNPFGHTGIISEVGDDYIELIQQNFGNKSRIKLKLVEYEGIFTIADYNVLGWLRYQDYYFDEN